MTVAGVHFSRCVLALRLLRVRHFAGSVCEVTPPPSSAVRQAPTARASGARQNAYDIRSDRAMYLCFDADASTTETDLDRRQTTCKVATPASTPSPSPLPVIKDCPHLAVLGFLRIHCLGVSYSKASSDVGCRAKLSLDSRRFPPLMGQGSLDDSWPARKDY